RRTPPDEEAFLAGLQPVEDASLERVSRTGLFRGLGAGSLFRMGVEAASSGRVLVREGYHEILLAGRASAVTILSVNWSRSFIRGVLHGRRAAAAAAPVTIIANEVAEDGRIVGPALDARGGRAMATAADKWNALRDIVAAGDETVVYCGDSVTDLACLLRSGRGIALAGEAGGESALLGTLARIGIELVHVADAEADADADADAGQSSCCAGAGERVSAGAGANANAGAATAKTVFWARDLNDVLRSGVLGKWA
ncbi:hypothetical protein E4U41_007445, partial [Claviceps citrina]